MKHTWIVACLVSCCFLLAQPHLPGFAQEPSEPEPNLPVKYEELTAPEFVQAVKLAEGVCILPIGILEKHGPHLPLGTDFGSRLCHIGISPFRHI